MSSNTPGYPGGYPNYPPQPDQGYGATPSPSYGGRPDSYGGRQPSHYGDAQRPLSDPSAARYYDASRGPGTAPAPKSRRGLWIGLIAAIVVVLLLVGGAGILMAYQSSEATKPIAAASAYCQYLKAQNYTGAYAMLSSAYKAKISQAQYTQANSLHDQLDGKVKDCGVQNTPASGFSLAFNNTAADLSATITRNKPFSGGISLVKEGDNWKVNAVDESLQGTDVEPLAVGQSFCSALAAKNYAAAYGDFSAKRQQAIGSQSDYANAMKANFNTGGVSITGCKMRLDTYSVAPAGDAASVTMELDVKVSTSSGSQVQAVPLKIRFTKSGDQWKIDDAEVSS
jgi:ketosteroid isomerase-like protein